jgi:hypothetical protein
MASEMDYPASRLPLPTRCTAWSGITVRNQPESVYGLLRNQCTESIGTGVRNAPEDAPGKKTGYNWGRGGPWIFLKNAQKLRNMNLD